MRKWLVSTLVGLNEPWSISGGGLNVGLIKRIEELGFRLLVHAHPQFTDALGAAIIAKKVISCGLPREQLHDELESSVIRKKLKLYPYAFSITLQFVRQARPVWQQFMLTQYILHIRQVEER